MNPLKKVKVKMTASYFTIISTRPFLSGHARLLLSFLGRSVAWRAKKWPRWRLILRRKLEIVIIWLTNLTPTVRSFYPPPHPSAFLHRYCVLPVFKANEATRIGEKSKEGFEDTSGDRAGGLSHRRPRTNHLCRSLLLQSRNLPFSVLCWTAC